jgi:hypothetical protein
MLVIFTSAKGIFTPDFYSKETFNWQVQSTGQDIVDLFLIAPALLITSILASRNNRNAMLLWGGTVLYLTYTFAIFCFNIHFNELFILYCFEFGLSFYSFMFFLLTQNKSQFPEQSKTKFIVKFTGTYFIFVSVIFYLMWLSEIIPAILGRTVPHSLVESGLITNPVHVIDLSVLLPGTFITGILLLKGKKPGIIFAPAILMFFVLMYLTIAFLIVFMENKGLAGDLTVALIICLQAPLSAVILILYLRSIKILHNPEEKN